MTRTDELKLLTLKQVIKNHRFAVSCRTAAAEYRMEQLRKDIAEHLDDRHDLRGHNND